MSNLLLRPQKLHYLYWVNWHSSIQIFATLEYNSTTNNSIPHDFMSEFRSTPTRAIQ